ncbi:MAG: hypothetical protein AAGI11_01375 [Pseudomonadota bacterium]
MGRGVRSCGGATPASAEKARIRAEIEDQVEQFLKRGGHIDVLGKDIVREDRQVGSIWQNLDDEIGLSG